MSETARPPAADETGESLVEEAQEQERVDVDPEKEPNAPNRGTETEYVRHDLNDDTFLDEPSDSDPLDKPDSDLGP